MRSRGWFLLAVVGVWLALLPGCPKPLDLNDLELASLEVTTTSALRLCVNDPPQLVVTVTDTQGKTYQTWQQGEGRGGKLRFEDFAIETSYGRVDENGFIVLPDPLRTLEAQLVVRVRPAGPTGPGTRTGAWVKDEVTLTPAYDCLRGVAYGGELGRNGADGPTGTPGRDGEDVPAGDGKSCNSAPNGMNGRDGGAGQHGTPGGNGAHVVAAVGLVKPAWRDPVVLIRAEVTDNDAGTHYLLLEPDRVDGFVLSVAGGPGGDGGRGGRGGDGGDGGDVRCDGGTPGNGGNGGYGGNGGDGGDGGDGGVIRVYVAEAHIPLTRELVFANHGGPAGEGGQAGAGGNGGRGGTSKSGDSGFPGRDGQYGRDGQTGQDGSSGPPVVIESAPAADLFADELRAGVEVL